MGHILNKVFLEDYLIGVKKIPDASVEMVCIDPPYFIDGMGSDWDKNKLNDKSKKAGVVKSLPVGMKFDPQQGRQFQKFMDDVAKESYRILKPGGFFLCFSQGRLYHRMAVAVEDAGFEVRDMLVWAREGQAKAFSQDHFVRKMAIPDSEKENILKSLDGRKTPQLKTQSEPIVLAQKPREGTFVENWMNHGTGLIDTTQSLDGKFPGTVIHVAKPSKEERVTEHLTVKPVLLIQHLLNVFTKEGDTCVDFFMGSFTTAVACHNTNRNFIGFEREEDYYNQGYKRLYDAGFKEDDEDDK